MFTIDCSCGLSPSHPHQPSPSRSRTLLGPPSSRSLRADTDLHGGPARNDFTFPLLATEIIQHVLSAACPPTTSGPSLRTSSGSQSLLSFSMVLLILWFHGSAAHRELGDVLQRHQGELVSQDLWIYQPILPLFLLPNPNAFSQCSGSGGFCSPNTS